MAEHSTVGERERRKCDRWILCRNIGELHYLQPPTRARHHQPNHTCWCYGTFTGRWMYTSILVCTCHSNFPCDDPILQKPILVICTSNMDGHPICSMVPAQLKFFCRMGCKVTPPSAVFWRRASCWCIRIYWPQFSHLWHSPYPCLCVWYNWSVTVEEAPISFSPFSPVDCTLLSHFSFNDFVALAFLDLARDLDTQI